MLTPAGKECKYFYGDYYRGRNLEECRLLEPAGLRWTPDLCRRCPLPDILIANACEHMQFRPRLTRPLLSLKSRVEVDVYCTKCECDVQEPKVGCGQCHPLPDVFVVSPDDPHSAS